MSKVLKIAKYLRMIAAELDVVATPAAEPTSAEDSDQIKQYRALLTKMKNGEGIKKIKFLLDNPRLRGKQDKWWFDNLDDGNGAGALEIEDVIKQLKVIMQRDLPVLPILQKVLNYGVANGYTALNRILEKGRVKMTLLQEEKKNK